MEFNLKLNEKYLIKPKLPFFYEENRNEVAAGDVNNASIRSQYNHDYRDEYCLIQIKGTETVDEFFHKIYFVHVNMNNMGYYTRYSFPFFYVYDDSKLSLSEFFWSAILRNNTYLIKASDFKHKICHCNDEDFENKLVENKDRLEALRIEEEQKIKNQLNIISEQYKTYFAQRVEFNSYDNKVQQVLKDATDGDKPQN